MKTRNAIRSLFVFSVSFLAAEEKREPASPPFVDLGWESWMLDLSSHLKAREQKGDETLVHSFFSVGGRSWQLRWLPLRKPEGDHASTQLGISEVIRVAEDYLSKNLPGPITNNFSVNGCQKFYLNKNDVYIWLVDLKIHPQFYVRTGPPVRNLISIPIDEAGNMLCEIVETQSKAPPDVPTPK